MKNCNEGNDPLAALLPLIDSFCTYQTKPVQIAKYGNFFLVMVTQNAPASPEVNGGIPTLLQGFDHWFGPILMILCSWSTANKMLTFASTSRKQGADQHVLVGTKGNGHIQNLVAQVAVPPKFTRKKERRSKQF
jgi:hypothetical protein